MHYSPTPMHIPDGFLSVYVAVIFWIVSLVLVVYALKRVNQDLGERQVPLMGVLAAAIFAGQMLNFAVAGGTSGHMVGATLATILLGPWAAILVMTCVVGVQALIFQDGGLLALGANIFNMAIIGVSVSYFAYRTVQKLAGGKPWGLYVGGFASAWLAVFIASLAAALELAISGTSPANIALPAMGGVHALIGIGEGLITMGALAFLAAVRPDLVKRNKTEVPAGRVVWLVFNVAIALLLMELGIYGAIEHILSLYGDHGEGHAKQLDYLVGRIEQAINELESRRRDIETTLAELRMIHGDMGRELAARRRGRKAVRLS